MVNSKLSYSGLSPKVLDEPMKRNEVSDQHSHCFNVEDDPKTFDEAMKSQDVAFWKRSNYPAMKESKAYKAYLGYATGAVPPKIARKFKKASPSKKDKKHMWKTKSKSKEKEKVDVTLRKGIKLLSEVALIEEAQMKELGVPDVTEDDSTESESESWGNDEDDSNNDD
ncbi:hypothetical protein Tco_1515674 [Tanacetum coccineum]